MTFLCSYFTYTARIPKITVTKWKIAKRKHNAIFDLINTVNYVNSHFKRSLTDEMNGLYVALKT